MSTRYIDRLSRMIWKGIRISRKDVYKYHFEVTSEEYSVFPSIVKLYMKMILRLSVELPRQRWVL